MKTFLLFDGLRAKNDFILRLMGALANDGLEPLLLAKPGSLLANSFKERGWRVKAYRFLPRSFLGLLIFSPLVWPLALVRLAFYRQVFKIESVICLGAGAKFLLTPPAKLLGLKVIWLELPNFDYHGLGRLGWRLFKLLAEKTSLVCFSLTTKLTLLSLGLKDDNLVLIWPGVEAVEFQNQATLFQNLANQGYNRRGKNFFTIGTIVDLKEPQQTEILMRAVKDALLVVPNLRLIVIGDGLARDQALWLSKQLNLEQAVWLVGSQTDLKKWYGNFDVFVVASSTPGLDDWLVALAAMINGVPVIAPRDLSLEDCFLGGKAGILLSLNDVEELSGAIIKLEQDKNLRKNLSDNARRVAKDFFALSRAKDEFKLILKIKL